MKQLVVLAVLIVAFNKAQAQETVPRLDGRETKDETTTAAFGNSVDPATRLIRENIYILRHARSNRQGQWCRAIQTLVQIGSPAVPELVQELDRPNRPGSLRFLAFTLRAIDDPACVPALIRALSESHNPYQGSSGLFVDDKALLGFMQTHDRDRKNESRDSFSLGPAHHELIDALESLTRHSSPELSRAEERSDVLSDESPDAKAKADKLFREIQGSWEQWWMDHKHQLLSEEQTEPSYLGTAVSYAIDPIEEAGRRKFGTRFPTGAEGLLGPVREVSLDAEWTTNAKGCIDFDRQVIMAQREGIESSELVVKDPPENIARVDERWFVRNGMDSLAAGWRLSNRDLHIWQIENSRWHSIDEEVLKNEPLSLGVERAFFQPIRMDGQFSELHPTETTTYLFTTREGGHGILQLPARKLTDPMLVRYRLWTTESPAAITIEPALIQPLDSNTDDSWLPEQSIVLHNAKHDEHACFRFSDNSLVRVPEELSENGWNTEAATKWLESNKIDLYTSPMEIVPLPADEDDQNEPAPVEVLCLFARKMRCVIINAEGFENLDVAQVNELLNRWPHFESPTRPLSGDTGGGFTAFRRKRPCIHAFRTSDGRCGMVCYLCPHNETQSITVRLKLEKPK